MNRHFRGYISYPKLGAIILFLIFLGTVFLFAVTGFVVYSKFVSMVFAFPFSYLFAQRVRRDIAGLQQTSSSKKEIRQILDRHLYQGMAYRYGNKNEVNNNYYTKSHELDPLEVLASPVVIIFCLCIACITFIDPIYFELEPASNSHLFRLVLISTFQVLLFSAAIDGLIVIFIRKQGRNK